MEQETKKCPYCGEEILAVAKKCKYCGEWLTDEKAEDTPKQMISCPICSEIIEEGTEICPHCHERLTPPKISAPSMDSLKQVGEKKSHSFIKKLAFVICAVFLSFVVIIFLINGCLSLAFGGGEVVAPDETLVNKLKEYGITLGKQEYDTGIYKVQVTSDSHNYDLYFKLLIKCEDGTSQYDEVTTDNEDWGSDIKAGQTTWFTDMILTQGDVVSVQIVDAYIDGKSVIKKSMGKEKGTNLFVSEPYVEICEEKTTITTIEITETQTIVTFQFVAETDGTWINISADTYIEANHMKYKLVDTDGIPLSPETLSDISADEVVTFKLFFPPIPKDTEVLDIYEETETGWHWMNVHLNK